MDELLPNERFALERRAYYDSIGLIVDEKNGEFAHCPLPERYGDKGYYLLHNDHQHQGLLQSKDIGEYCFFSGDAKKWLLTCEIFPDNYFELWDIYEEYAGENAVKGGYASMEEKDESGRSKHAVEMNRRSEQKRREVLSKPVIALAEDGRKINFSSIVSCAIEFDVNESAVRKWIRKARILKVGKAKGWRFVLADR